MNKSIVRPPHSLSYKQDPFYSRFCKSTKMYRTAPGIHIWFCPPLLLQISATARYIVITLLLEQAPDWLTRHETFTKVQFFQLVPRHSRESHHSHKPCHSHHVIHANPVIRTTSFTWIASFAPRHSRESCHSHHVIHANPVIRTTSFTRIASFTPRYSRESHYSHESRHSRQVIHAKRVIRTTSFTWIASFTRIVSFTPHHSCESCHSHHVIHANCASGCLSCICINLTCKSLALNASFVSGVNTPGESLLTCRPS